jgi:hypothetical protein
MRRLPGKLRPLASFLSASLLMLSLVCRDRFAFSQAQEPLPFPTAPAQNPGRVPFGPGRDSTDNPDPNVRHAQQEAARRRNIERQNRMVANSNRIVQLAQELNAEVDKSNKSAPPITVSKKAEEIEKLAKSVKDLMKSE